MSLQLIIIEVNYIKCYIMPMMSNITIKCNADSCVYNESHKIY